LEIDNKRSIKITSLIGLDYNFYLDYKINKTYNLILSYLFFNTPFN